VADPATLVSTLPPEVAIYERRTDVDVESMHADEAAFIGHATPRRQAEFATVRWCARQCFQELGRPFNGPLIPREDRRPTWPTGLVGSFTHCDGFRAAAVGRSTLVGLGIDAEPNEVLPDRVLGRVAHESEQTHLAELAQVESAIAWDRLLFSAKESVFKAWHPLIDIWIGFRRGSRPHQRCHPPFRPCR